MKKIILLITILVTVKNTNAQPPERFYTRFGGNGHDIGYGVKQTLDGHYIVTGSTSSFGAGNTDILIAKIDSMGWVRWQKAIGGFNNDIGKAIIQIADSGFVIAGYTNSYGNGGYDAYLVKTDKNGELIWQKTFGGIDWDFAYNLIETPDGGFVLCGNTYSYGYGKSDGYIIKTDANGNAQWQKTFGGNEDDEFKSVKYTTDNHLILTGVNKSSGDLNGDLWFFKTNTIGDSIFTKVYGGIKSDFGNDLIEDDNGDYVLAGGSETYSSGGSDAFIIKINSGGNLIWQANDGVSSFNEEIFKIIKSKTDVYQYVIIFTTQEIAGTKKDLKKGIMNWAGFYEGSLSGTFGFLDDDEVFGLSNTKDKGFVAVGYTKSLNAILEDVFLIKFDSLGYIPQNQSTISVKETNVDIKNIKIYPRITNSSIKIENLRNDIEFILTIFSIAGSPILKKILKSGSYEEIDLITLSNGMYYARIECINYSVTYKIIKN